jgi:tetratricopeptide (TPR) repeat protein
MFHELWDRADPEATGNRFRETLPGVEASADLDLLVQLLTQIARTHSLQMQFPEAHQLLDRAEGLLTPELVVGRIRVLLERGRAFNSANEKEKSRPLFVEAWELASGAGEAYHAADAAHMMGIAGESASVQLDWNLKAMNVAEGSSNPHVRQWLGPLYNNIGWTYHDDGGYAKALDLFQKSLQWREEEAEPRKAVPIRIARWCIARTLRSLGRLEEALARQLALLQEWQEAGGQDGYVVEELAECLLALGREQEARPYFAKAYEQLSQDGWLVANEAARLERLLDLGREEV